MDLLVIQLKAAIRRLLETKGVRARVLDKVNRYGEVVIGVILEPPSPAPRVGGGVTEPEKRACDDSAPAARSEGAPDERSRAEDGEDVVT